MEHAAKLAPENPEVLYDLSVIQLAAGQRDKALENLERAIKLNPNLKKQAIGDNDLQEMRDDPKFKKIVD